MTYDKIKQQVIAVLHMYGFKQDGALSDSLQSGQAWVWAPSSEVAQRYNAQRLKSMQGIRMPDVMTYFISVGVRKSIINVKFFPDGGMHAKLPCFLSREDIDRINRSNNTRVYLAIKQVYFQWEKR